MTRALIIGILSAAALAACSATPSHPFPSASSVPAQADLRASRTASAIAPGWCSTADGKALRPGSSDCNSITRKYSGEQLRATGMTDAAHALQMLDPSITAHGP
jgi:hypothetical protein